MPVLPTLCITRKIKSQCHSKIIPTDVICVPAQVSVTMEDVSIDTDYDRLLDYNPDTCINSEQALMGSGYLLLNMMTSPTPGGATISVTFNRKIACSKRPVCSIEIPKCSKIQIKSIYAVADLHRKILDMPAPFGFKFFQFHSVWETLIESYVGASPQRVGASTSGKSWIRH